MEAVCAHDNVSVARLVKTSDVNTQRTAVVPDGSTALLWAVLSRNVQGVRMLLRAGACPNIAPFSGRSILQHAIERRGPARLTIIKLLLKGGADVAHRDRSEGTAVTSAAAMGDIDTVSALAAMGASMDAPVLSMLIRAGRRFEAVPLGLETCINAVDANGRTALMHAVTLCSLTASALLDAGADVAIADNGGHTALSLAATTDRGDWLLVSLALAGAPLNHTNMFGLTAAAIAASSGLHQNLAMLRICGAAMPTTVAVAERGPEASMVESISLLASCSPYEASLLLGIPASITALLGNWAGSTHDGVEAALTAARPEQLRFCVRAGVPWRLKSHRRCSRLRRAAVRAVLLCMRRFRAPLPFEMIERIMLMT